MELGHTKFSLFLLVRSHDDFVFLSTQFCGITSLVFFFIVKYRIDMA